MTTQKERPMPEVKFFDAEINDNPAQADAVRSVVGRCNDNVPFLLFGAFGTGKTKTLVCN